MAERVFTLPDLGEGLEEATVTEWLVAEGDAVELNQPIAEIETAKATVEMPSPFAGRIARLHVAAGAEAKVGAPLVTFEVQDVEGGDAGPPAAGPRRGAGDAGSTGLEGGAASPAALRPGTPARPRERDEAGARATPAVRRVAKELGVDLRDVVGTGPGGRVTREDVERAASGSSDSGVEAISLMPVRRAIADRLTQVARIPQVTTFRTVDCTELDSLRRELGLSPLPVFVRALVETCAGHPLLSSSWDEDRILVRRTVNVGVATDTERGLVVPVIPDAGPLGISAIASEIGRLAEAARTGGLRPQDTADATIAVSNTGSYGSEYGTPLLNPGHAVTIALGVIEPRALVVGGNVEARLACTISLTFDHRVLDGATVGRALGDLVALLESRERLDALPR